MRVLVCGRGAADPRSAVWRHVVTSLRTIGHEVVTLDPSSPGTSGLVRGDAETALRTVLARFEPHVMVHLPTDTDLDPVTVREATGETTTVAVALHMSTVFSDAPSALHRLDEHLWHYDLVTVPDQWTHDRYAPIGDYRVVCLPPAVHPASLDDGVAADRSGVVVVGEPDDASAAAVRELVETGVDVTLVGAGWSLHPDLEPLSFPRVAGPELATVLAGAALHLELPLAASTQSRVGLSPWEAPVGQVALEAAAVQTPTLTLARPGLKTVFSPGVDIATYERLDDLAVAVRLLLSDEPSLRALGDAASDTVRATATWIERWERLFSPFAMPDDADEWVSMSTTAAPAAAVTPEVVNAT